MAAVVLAGCWTGSPPPPPRAPTPTRVPIVRIAPPGTSLDGDKLLVRRGIRRHFDQFQACYDTALAADPTLTTVSLTVKFDVEADGRVDGAAVTAPTAGALAAASDLSQCLVGVLRSIQFARPTAKVVVSYPFDFHH